MLKFKDYDPDYPEQSPQNLLKKPTLIVCNHVGIIEMLFICSKYTPCGVASSEIGDVPFYGTILAMNQSIFVKRNSKKSKGNILQKITERLDLCEENENMPPLLCFPEGTTTSGQYIV